MDGSDSTSNCDQAAAASSDSPLVSVVIPTFNSAVFVGCALASVFDQDYPNIEIIVVDDGSTDDTRELISSYGSRVRLLTQPNQGSGAARNQGIQCARGHYVAFLDADDVWWHHKLRHQVDALSGTGHRMAYSRFIRWAANETGSFTDAASEFLHENNPNISTAPVVSGSPYAELLLDCIVWTSTVIVEKCVLKQVGMFDESLRKGQDYDLWLRLSREVSMLGMEMPTALYRSHIDSITASVKPVNYEYLILSSAVERWGEAGPDGRHAPAGQVSRRLARSSLGHGVSHLRGGDPRVAARSFAQSMRHQGFSPKLIALWLMALAKQAASSIRLPSSSRA